jgi:hypothetical protein
VQPEALASGLAGKADLVGGVVPTSQIPAIAISEYLGAVASQAAMLALVGQRGDWCVRTDGANAGAWILAAEPSSTLGNWVQVPVAPAPVQSINGQTGTVVLGPADIGAATAAQGTKADSAIQPGNAALFDAREWTAETISQDEAEAGTATTRRAFTAQRVFQAVTAWWAASAAATKLAGIASGATANQADAYLLARGNHTGTQTASTISDLGALATRGFSDATPQAPATSGAAGTAVTAARGDHVHPLPPLVTTTTAGLARPVDLGDLIILACSDETTDLTTGTAKITFRMPWAATLTSVRLSVNTAPTGAALIVDVNEGGTSVFSTRPQIDISAKTSVGSSVTPVISDSALAADAEITVDIDQVGSTAKGKGLKVALYVTRVQA